jgi:hypothetical protein
VARQQSSVQLAVSYLLAPAKADWTYRLLSWFTGTATVGLAGLIARRQFQLLHPGEAPGRAWAAGLITATLVGGSYFLIHYFAEARGRWSTGWPTCRACSRTWWRFK